MRGAHTEFDHDQAEDNATLRALSAWAATLGVFVTGFAATADTNAEEIPVRIYSIQASGLSTYDCSIQVEVHNRMDLMVRGFAANLVFFDLNGVVIARKPFEMTRIRPNARRREGLGFKLDLPADRDAPRNMTELIDQCDVLASAEIGLRACESDRGSIFSRCQSGMVAHTASELPLAIRRDAVAEAVDYGVVALPQGHRAESAEQTVIDPLGLTVSTITEDLAWQVGLSPVTQGLLVVALAPGGPAEIAGLRTEDVIVEIDQDPMLEGAKAMEALGFATLQSR